MNRIRSNFGMVILSLLLCGCTIDISPPIPAADLLQTTVTPATTVLAATDNIKKLNLSGKLVYTSGKLNAVPGKVSLDLSVQSLDLATGQNDTVYSAPPGDWIDSATVSPDGKLLLITYQTSNETGQPGFYIMPLDGSQAPKLLLAPSSDKDVYYQPQWSPDGKYIYFTHKNYHETTTYEVMRMSYPDGYVEKLADQAFWPSASGNGLHITWVSINSQTGANDLFMANPDGTQAQQITITSSTNKIIDAPIFYPDNESILFSAPVSQQFSASNWIDKMLGVTTVYAHGSIPSEWWSISLAEGKPTQLTRVGLYGLFASFSPDQRYIASFSTNGIFVMKPDGTDLTNIVKDVGGILGTVNWIR